MHGKIVGSAADLNVSWSEFIRLLRAQEARWGTWHWTVKIFGQGSYLQEASECREAFETFGSLQSMDHVTRTQVGGWKSGYRYFGNMRAAGRYMGLVKNTPERVDALLDKIPSKGPVTEAQARAYLTGITAIEGVSIPGTATRLLVSKRPDVFMGLTSANKNGVQRVFGRSPRTVDNYLLLLRHVWSYPWCRAARPSDPVEAQVWEARVALLDAFCFNDGGGF